MASKSILLKVSPEVHTKIQEAAACHQRSMQSALVALIEGWLLAGGPDPLLFNVEKPQPASGAAIDREARRAIEALVERVSDLQEKVLSLTARRDPEPPGWAEKVMSDLGVEVERRGRSGGTPLDIAGWMVQEYDGQIPHEMRLAVANQIAAYQAGLDAPPPNAAATDGNFANLKKALRTRPSIAEEPLDARN